MRITKCPHCDSPYIDLLSAQLDVTCENATEHYYCSSCKSNFSRSYRIATPGLWLVTIHISPSNKIHAVQFFRDEKGLIICRQILKSSLLAYCDDEDQQVIRFKSCSSLIFNEDSMPFNYFFLNDELTRVALENPAMKAIHVSGNKFSLINNKNDLLANDVAEFLRIWTRSKSSKDEHCYIATCVYNSYDCPQVWTLRRFRDNSLAQSFCGRAFIRAYYAISPTVVKYFGKYHWFKKLGQRILDHLIRHLQETGVESTPYQDRN